MSDVRVHGLTSDGILLFLGMDAAEFLAELMAKYLSTHKNDLAVALCLNDFAEAIKDWKFMFDEDDE